MATYIENLNARKEAIGVELANMSATTAGGKPDAGKSGIGHVAYRMSLLEELKALEEMITAAKTDANLDSGNYFSLELGIT